MSKKCCGALTILRRVEQVYINKTVLRLNGNTFVEYPIYLLLLNFSKKLSKFFIDHGHTVVALLPETTSETTTDAEGTRSTLKQSSLPLSAVATLLEELPRASSTGAKVMTLKVLYVAMHKILGFLHHNTTEGFQISIVAESRTLHSNNNFMVF